MFRHEPYNSSVDVYSFSMILYQLFEHHPPFAGQDPVSACKSAAMENKRPELQRLNDKDPVVKVALLWAPHVQPSGLAPPLPAWKGSLTHGRLALACRSWGHRQATSECGS